MSEIIEKGTEALDQWREELKPLGYKYNHVIQAIKKLVGDISNTEALCTVLHERDLLEKVSDWGVGYHVNQLLHTVSGLEARQYYLDNYCDYLTDEQRAGIELHEDYTIINGVKMKAEDTPRPSVNDDDYLSKIIPLKQNVVGANDWKSIIEFLEPKKLDPVNDEKIEEEQRGLFLDGWKKGPEELKRDKQDRFRSESVAKFLLNVVGLKREGRYATNSMANCRTRHHYMEDEQREVIMQINAMIGPGRYLYPSVSSPAMESVDSYREYAA